MVPGCSTTTLPIPGSWTIWPISPQTGHACKRELDALLQRELDALGDEFLDGMSYINKWGYPLDDTGTVPFRC